MARDTAIRTVVKLALLEVLHRQRNGAVAIDIGDAIFARQLGGDPEPVPISPSALDLAKDRR